MFTQCLLQAEASKLLQGQINSQNKSIHNLWKGIQLLEANLIEATLKKEELVRRTQSSQKVNDMLGGVTDYNVKDANYDAYIVTFCDSLNNNNGNPIFNHRHTTTIYSTFDNE